jgi:hypothetical protein
MGLLRQLFAGKAGHPPVAIRPLQGPMVDVEVVGESGYQDYLKRLARRRSPLTMVLKPDPDNPYDSNAVVVLIEDQTVGYLSRLAAKDWQPMLLAAEAEGFYCTGPAEVLGGTQNKPNVGVFGSVPWPGKGAPPDRWQTGRPAGAAGRPWPKQ